MTFYSASLTFSHTKVAKSSVAREKTCTTVIMDFPNAEYHASRTQGVMYRSTVAAASTLAKDLLLGYEPGSVWRAFGNRGIPITCRTHIDRDWHTAFSSLLC